MKKLLIVFLALFLVPSVFAAVEVTYTFNDNNVTVHPYNCLDPDCSVVGQFGGKVEGNTVAFGGSVNVDDGQLVIFHPNSLQNYGYAFFFTSAGWLPYEWKSTLHTGGHPGVAKTSQRIDFEQMSVCRAPISGLSYVNTVNVSQPLMIDATAALDSSTASAFSLAGNDILYVPPALVQRYYSADTDVELEVISNSGVVFEQWQHFNYTFGNALFAGASQPVTFYYNPNTAGEYTIRLTSHVSDEQCADYEPQSAQGELTVADPSATSYCIAYVNNLAVNDTHPDVGDSINVSYTVVAQKVGAAAEYIQAQVSHNVMYNGSVLFSSGLIDTPFTPHEVSFTFTPSSSGGHLINVTGEPHRVVCAGLNSSASSQVISVYVHGTHYYDLALAVKDSETGSALPDANVTIGTTTLATDANGMATFNLAEGTYSYTIVASGYPPKSDVVVLDRAKLVTVYLRTANSAPLMRLPDEISLHPTTFEAALDLKRYTTDDHDLPENLVYAVRPNSNLTMSIQNGVATLKSNLTGVWHMDTFVMFNATDSDGLTGSDVIRVRGDSDYGGVPVFRVLPNHTMSEDTESIRVFDLHEYVSDNPTTDDALTYSVVNVTSSGVAVDDFGVFIESDRYLSVIPYPDFFGVGTVYVRVSDGKNHSTSSFTLTILPVNDAPVPIVPCVTFSINESQVYTYDLHHAFVDVDDDFSDPDFKFLFTVPDTMVVFEVVNGTLTLQPRGNFIGVQKVNITARDPHAMTAKVEFTIVVNDLNDAPFIVGVIPDVDFDEDGSYGFDLTPFENDEEDGPAANDNDLTWAVVGANASLCTYSINSASDFFSLVGRPDMFGQDVITLVLTDSRGLNATQNITVTINGINDAPVLQAIPDQDLQFGSLLTIQVNASDVDPDTLRYFDNTTLFNINETAGLINSTINVAGLYSINVTVCDDSGAVNNCTDDVFLLNVTDSTAPVIFNVTAPAQPSFFVSSGTNYQFSANVTDNAGIDEVVFNFNGTIFTIMNATVAGNTYTFTVNGLSPAVYTYSFFANDTQGNSATSGPYTWTLNKSQSVVQLTLDGNQDNVTVDQNTTVDVIGTLTTPAAGNVSIDVTGSSSVTGVSPLATTVTKIDVGTYAVTARFDESQDYAASSATHYIIVQDSTAPVFGTESITPVNGSLLATQYTFDIIITDNVGVTNVTFTFDGSPYNVTNPSGNTYRAVIDNITTEGDYQYTWTANDARNNINTTTRPYSILPDLVPPFFTAQSVPSNPTPFAPSYTFTVDVDDNVMVDTARLFIDGTEYFHSGGGGGSGSSKGFVFTVGPFSAGEHDYHFVANDTSGNQNTTSTDVLNISKGTPSFSLTLNGVAGPTTIPVNDTVNVLASIVNPPGASFQFTLTAVSCILASFLSIAIILLLLLALMFSASILLETLMFQRAVCRGL